MKTYQTWPEILVALTANDEADTLCLMLDEFFGVITRMSLDRNASLNLLGYMIGQGFPLKAEAFKLDLRREILLKKKGQP